MNLQTHDSELRELFKGEQINISADPKIANEVKATIKRGLSRLEIGHCFSLGLTEIKRSSEGLTLKFDLTKASINTIYQNLEDN